MKKKKIKMWVTYPWVGVEPDEIEFETCAEDENEIENDVYDEAISAIFNKGVGYDYEVEEIEEDE